MACQPFLKRTRFCWQARGSDPRIVLRARSFCRSMLGSWGSCPPQWRRQQVSTRQCSTLFSPRSSAAASASPLAVTFFAGFYCTWDSILVSGSPERGLQKGSAARCCVTGRQLTDARVLLAVAGAENVPHARREVTHALLAKHGKTGECLMMVQCSCTNLPFFLSSLVHQQAAFEKNTPKARGTGSKEAPSSRE